MAKVSMMKEDGSGKIIFGVVYKGVAGCYLIDVWGIHHDLKNLSPVTPQEKYSYLNSRPKAI